MNKSEHSEPKEYWEHLSDANVQLLKAMAGLINASISSMNGMHSELANEIQQLTPVVNELLTKVEAAYRVEYNKAYDAIGKEK